MATDAPTKRMIHAAKLVAVTISFTYVVESLCLLRYRDRQDRQNHVWPQQERPRDERAPLDKKSQDLCSSFDVPSVSRIGAAKKRHKGKKMQKAEGCGIQFPEDSDSGDSTFMLAEACDSEKPWEEDIQDEFLMWSGSIADAACIMPEYWVLCD